MPGTWSSRFCEHRKPRTFSADPPRSTSLRRKRSARGGTRIGFQTPKISAIQPSQGAVRPDPKPGVYIVHTRFCPLRRSNGGCLRGRPGGARFRSDRVSRPRTSTYSKTIWTSDPPGAVASELKFLGRCALQLGMDSLDTAERLDLGRHRPVQRPTALVRGSEASLALRPNHQPLSWS